GTKTAAKSAGAGTRSVSESASITGLKAGTTYHYRLVATSAAGTTAGRDRTLSTAGAPPAPTGAAQAGRAPSGPAAGGGGARRGAHHLVLGVGGEPLLGGQDGEEERRRCMGGRVGHRLHRRASARHDLPLPRRGHERRRGESRRRRDVHDRRRDDRSDGT